MDNFGGFGDEDDDENIPEDVADISDIQPEFDEVFQSVINENQPGRRREGSERISKPILKKLAISRLLSARSGQLQLGAPSLIPIHLLNSSELHEIAIQEFNEAVKGNLIFPIKIVRKFADGTYEVWRVGEFKHYERDIGGRSQRSRQRKFGPVQTSGSGRRF